MNSAPLNSSERENEELLSSEGEQAQQLENWIRIIGRLKLEKHTSIEGLAERQLAIKMLIALLPQCTSLEFNRFYRLIQSDVQLARQLLILCKNNHPDWKSFLEESENFVRRSAIKDHLLQLEDQQDMFVDLELESLRLKAQALQKETRDINRKMSYLHDLKAASLNHIQRKKFMELLQRDSILAMLCLELVTHNIPEWEEVVNQCFSLEENREPRGKLIERITSMLPALPLESD